MLARQTRDTVGRLRREQGGSAQGRSQSTAYGHHTSPRGNAALRLTAPASSLNTPRSLLPPRSRPALLEPPCSAPSHSKLPHSSAGSSPPPPNDNPCRTFSR